MSEMKHSAEPWKINGWSGSPSHPMIDGADSRGTILTCFHETGTLSAFGRGNTMWATTMRLAAAHIALMTFLKICPNTPTTFARSGEGKLNP